MEPYVIGSHQTSVLYMVIVGQFEIHNPQQEQDTESGAIEAASNE